LPHRGVTNRDPIDQDVLAAVWLNEVRTQTRSFSKDAFTYGSSFRSEIDQPLPGCCLTRSQVPPVCVVRLAVQDSSAGDRQISLFKGVNEGRVIHQLGSF